MTASPTHPQTQPIAQQGIAEIIAQNAAELTASEQATLTLEDLPSGFAELPPELAAEVASRLDTLREQLGQNSLKPDNFFAFVNQQNFQLVFGFTGKIPDQAGQASFDASLQQFKQPEAQEQMVSQLRERLKNFGEIKITEYGAIPELNALANASTGLTLGLEMQKQPLRLDFAAFRRNSVGVFTAVMYAKGEQPAIGVEGVAQKLDDRIVKSSTDANGSSLERVGQ